MLVQFSVKNHRSIGDTVTLDLSASALRESEDLEQANTFWATPRLRLLKSAVIYGANASGKSNILDALGFMRHLVTDSARESQAGDEIEAEPFLLNEDFETQPSMFEVVFFSNDIRYRYGFEVTSKEVVSEWLYYVPKEREALLFDRDEEKFTLSSKFQEGKELERRTRKNALFLSVVAQFNGERATEILRWFRRIAIVSGIRDLGYSHFTANSILNESLSKPINNLVKSLDVGIKKFVVQDQEPTSDDRYEGLPQILREALEKLAEEGKGELRQLSVLVEHDKYSEGERVGTTYLNLDRHESEGTKKLFALAGPILDSLKCGRTFIVDEMDARFHPLITETIVKLFNSKETNRNKAQLVFVTHDVNLLSRHLFRRDQIWFAEKDPHGATDLYSLAEYKLPNDKKVRNDASYERDYLAGRYGAIPFIGAIDFLEELQRAKQEASQSC